MPKDRDGNPTRSLGAHQQACRLGMREGSALDPGDVACRPERIEDVFAHDVAGTLLAVHVINSTGPSTGGGRRRADLRGIFAIAHVALQCQSKRCGTCVREVGCVSGAEEQPEEPTAASAHQCDQCAASVASSSRTVAGGAAVHNGAWNRINVQMAAGASAASMRALVAAMRSLGHDIKRRVHLNAAARRVGKKPARVFPAMFYRPSN